MSGVGEVGDHPGDLLSAWLDGELSAADATSVAAHVEACPGCAAEHEEVRAARAALRGLAVLVPPAGVLVPSPVVHLGDLLSARLDAELEPDHAAGIDAHLAACPACAAELDEVAWARALVRGLPELDPPGQALRPGVAPAVLRPQRVQPRQVKAALAAAAAAVIGIVGLLGRPAPADTSRPSVASFVAQHSTSSPGPDAVSGLAPAALPVSFSR